MFETPFSTTLEPFLTSRLFFLSRFVWNLKQRTKVSEPSPSGTVSLLSELQRECGLSSKKGLSGGPTGQMHAFPESSGNLKMWRPFPSLVQSDRSLAPHTEPAASPSSRPESYRGGGFMAPWG